MDKETGQKVGAVLVVGAGVGGMQASLDLAESGYKVYLVEKGPSIGGVMAQLDKTFPTNDCAMCTLAPRMVDCGGHLNIEKLTYSEVESIEGSAGNFKVSIRKKARSVDPDKCTGCGECVESCLVKNIVYLDQPGRAPVQIEESMRVKVDDILNRYEGGREIIVPPNSRDKGDSYRAYPSDSELLQRVQSNAEGKARHSCLYGNGLLCQRRATHFGYVCEGAEYRSGGHDG